jgi:hypothetical protein
MQSSLKTHSMQTITRDGGTKVDVFIKDHPKQALFLYHLTGHSPQGFWPNYVASLRRTIADDPRWFISLTTYHPHRDPSGCARLLWSIVSVSKITEHNIIPYIRHFDAVSLERSTRPSRCCRSFFRLLHDPETYLTQAGTIHAREPNDNLGECHGWVIKYPLWSRLEFPLDSELLQ